jgi:hypothetical protein
MKLVSQTRTGSLFSSNGRCFLFQRDFEGCTEASHTLFEMPAFLGDIRKNLRVCESLLRSPVFVRKFQTQPVGHGTLLIRVRPRVRAQINLFPSCRKIVSWERVQHNLQRMGWVCEGGHNGAKRSDEATHNQIPPRLSERPISGSFKHRLQGVGLDCDEDWRGGQMAQQAIHNQLAPPLPKQLCVLSVPGTAYRVRG